MTIWLTAGGATLLALGGYAAWLWRRVWLHQQALRVQRGSQQALVLDQLEVLARTVVQGQVNVTEGALRMATLLDLMVEPPPQQHQVDLAAIHQLAAAAQPFAVSAQRQALARVERRRQDQRREQLEAEQGEAVEAAAQRLLAVLPQWRSGKPR